MSDTLSVLPREMEEISASQSKMLDHGRKIGKKKPSATVTNTEGVAKKAKTEGDVEKSNTKEEDVKDENKDQVKQSVVLAKSKELDVYVPVTSGNAIDFQSLQGLINIHFHFHNK